MPTMRMRAFFIIVVTLFVILAASGGFYIYTYVERAAEVSHATDTSESPRSPITIVEEEHSVAASADVLSEEDNGGFSEGASSMSVPDAMEEIVSSAPLATKPLASIPPATVTPVALVLSLPSSVPFGDVFTEKGRVATRTPPREHYIAPEKLSPRPVNPRTVVLVRCVFKSGDREVGGALGSGVVISPEGHILTAAHILKPENDDAEKWKLDACSIAATDADLAPIDAYAAGNQRFIPAEVVYEPNDALYHNGHDLDFAILKIRDSSLPFVSMVRGLISLQPGDEVLALGYPGMETGLQALERYDGIYDNLFWFTDSLCSKSEVVKTCGTRYRTKRHKATYKPLYFKKTELGIYTSFIRGGFSGGPMFYQGNLIGILVTTIENAYSDLWDLSQDGYWNWLHALTTDDIVSHLKVKGIALPTVP